MSSPCFFRLLLLLQLGMFCCAQSSQPHILLIVADDLGWNDVGYHNPDMITPTIDELAAGGVKLDNYYVQPICTPSRAQLLTGKYQIHTGLQHDVIKPAQPSGLPLELPTLADQLRLLGYATHIVGKWHLGFYQKQYTPTYRGFDSFFGMLTGSADHYRHVNSGRGMGRGYDLWNNEQVAWNNSVYSTHLFAQKALDVIDNHDPAQPLFLYLPFQAPHGPNQVPEKYSNMYRHINNNKRRVFSGMVTCVDEAIHNITKALELKGLWDNTLTIFTTDNGAKVNTGSNWPLRGRKKTVWEGGLRGVAFVHGNMLIRKNRTTQALMDISDWFPTLVNLAGGQVDESMKLDGHDLWQSISLLSHQEAYALTLPNIWSDHARIQYDERRTACKLRSREIRTAHDTFSCLGDSSPRTELLHTIDPLWEKRGEQQEGYSFNSRTRAALRVGNWKLITGDPGDGSWVRAPTFNSSQYQKVNISESENKTIWLFDIENDPEEREDLSASHPEIVSQLMERLAAYEATAVPPLFPPEDPLSVPDLNGGVWGPWQKSTENQTNDGTLHMPAGFTPYMLLSWIVALSTLNMWILQ